MIVVLAYGEIDTKAEAEYDAMAKVINSSAWGDMVSGG
jgi:hypothetical protein